LNKKADSGLFFVLVIWREEDDYEQQARKNTDFHQ